MISVRAFAATDIESVQCIMASCTRELRAVYAPVPQADKASADHAPPGSRVVAVDHAGTVVGAAECIARPQALYVQGVAVAPTHRRCGVARALITYIVSLARDMGFPVLQVATIRETGNAEVFERLGFSVIEEQTSERFQGRHGQPVTEVTLERHVPDHSSHMTLRPAIPADAGAIGQIRVAAWRAAYQRFMPESYLAALNPSANLDSLRAKLASPADDFKLTVAEYDGLVAGFSIIGAPRYEAIQGHMELWALNVLPEYWRRGIGRSLTLHAVREAAALGCRGIELWCINGNAPAQAAYESCGFTLAGKERTSSNLTGHPLHEVLYSRSF